MQIPHRRLSAAALRAVVEEFVTRDGTDDSPIAGRIDSVLRQFDAGTLVLHYDTDTASCSIQAADGSPDR
jgi:uncharacterized protein YheU (UPF0270 family)